MTAEIIVEHRGLYDLTLNNIKACFRWHMMNTKLYDRLDGNIVMQWLLDFKEQMSAYCLEEHENEHKQAESTATTYDSYLANLKLRAESGEEKAIQMLTDIQNRKAFKTPEDKRKEEIEFRLFKYRYNQQQKNNDGN